LRIFEIFKKASRGLSAADLDHYGRGQTRSEYGPCDQVSSKYWSMLKGRSAGQRHTQTDTQTDRQRNSAKNNGPSCFQSGQQTNNDDYISSLAEAMKVRLLAIEKYRETLRSFRVMELWAGDRSPLAPSCVNITVMSPSSSTSTFPSLSHSPILFLCGAI